MSDKSKIDTSFPVIQSSSFFLIISAYWIYGIYTTFTKGSIPGINWSTEHNYLAGVLWTLVVGNGARVPLLTYVKASGVIALLDHGYLSLPVLFTNAIIQAYSWILIIVVWFPEPIPLPFIHVTGGFKTGAIMLLFLVPVLAFLNYFSAKLLLRLHSSLPTYSNTIESAQPKSVK